MSVVEDLENENLGLLKTVDDLKAEIERLRDALEQIKTISSVDGVSRMLDNCYLIARQALEGETK